MNVHICVCVCVGKNERLNKLSTTFLSRREISGNRVQRILILVRDVFELWK